MVIKEILARKEYFEDVEFIHNDVKQMKKHIV
jgi:hypothetical protein